MLRGLNIHQDCSECIQAPREPVPEAVAAEAAVVVVAVEVSRVEAEEEVLGPGEAAFREAPSIESCNLAIAP
jgi:hypothetical protein